MITYRIVSKRYSKPVEKQKKERADPSTPEGKEKIFSRVLTVAKKVFKEGNRITIYGTKTEGTVRKVLINLEEVTWHNNRPYFIEVDLIDGRRILANPFQLKRH